MSTLTVFRQERIDGGIRTGIDYEGMTILETFISGNEDNDPALLWYVDVKFAGDHIPVGSPELIRNWLIQIGNHVQLGLDSVAAELTAGIDGLIPISRKLEIPIAGLTVTVAATGIRRLSARAIGEKIREFAEQWREVLTSVQPLAPV